MVIVGNVAGLTYPTKTVLKYKLVLFCQSLYPPKSSVCDVTTVAVRISVTVTSRLSIRNLFVLACLFRESLSTKRKFKLKKFSWHFTMCQKMTLVWHFIKWRKINWTYPSWTKEEWCTFLFQKFWRLSKTHFQKSSTFHNFKMQMQEPVYFHFINFYLEFRMTLCGFRESGFFLTQACYI